MCIVAESKHEIDLEEALKTLQHEVGDWSGLGLDEKVKDADRLATLPDLEAMAADLPNPDCEWDEYITISLAFFAASGGEHFTPYKRWCEKSKKCGEKISPEDQWEKFRHSPPGRTGFGALVKRIKKIIPGWIAPSWRRGVTFDDFRAYMPKHEYIYVPARELWPASSVNARLRPVLLFKADGSPQLDNKGDQKFSPASVWLDKHQSVEQMTWAPGLPMLIADRLIADTGWIDKPGVTCFNLYRPPTIVPGDATLAQPWLDLVYKVFIKTDADHIIFWFAHRVQFPGIKINHGLVMGSDDHGIGKDTIIEALRRAVGAWNFQEVAAQEMLGGFNGFVKSVVLRVNEARDLGEMTRYQFYDHTKVYTAAPPNSIRCNEKNLREHYVINCLGMIITTNHKTDGIYLPPEDRRHFVAWSELTREDFEEDFWKKFYSWLDAGGDRHVAAYLATLDLSSFDAKAPPPKTEAFWEIVNANRAPEDAELSDVIDRIEDNEAITIEMIADFASEELQKWMRDRKHRRMIPHRLSKCGFVPVRNEAAKDGLWKVWGSRQVIYVRRELTVPERLAAAARRAESERPM